MDEFEQYKRPVNQDDDFSQYKRVVANSSRPQIPEWKSALRGAAQGLTSGFADELTAGAESLVTPKTYEQALAQNRRDIEEFAAANPKTALALNIAGGTVMPAGVIAKGGKAALTLGNLAKTGAVTGAITGFGTGEGGLGNRLSSATSGAALGVAAPVVGKTIVGTASLAGKGGKKSIQALAGVLNNAVGASNQSLSSKGVKALLKQLPKSTQRSLKNSVNKIARGDGLETAERYVIKELQDAGVDADIAKKTAAALSSAAKTKTPLGIADELTQDAINEGATGVRKNNDIGPKLKSLFSGVEEDKAAQSIISKRKSETVDRISEAVDSTKKGSGAKGEQVSNFLNQTVAAEKQYREKLSSNIYKESYKRTPYVSNKKIDRLIQKDENIQNFLKIAQGTPAGKQVVKSLKRKSNLENSSKLLHLTKQLMKQAAGDSKFRPNKAALMQSATKLQKALYESEPGLKRADYMFSKGSERLNILQEDFKPLLKLAEKQDYPRLIKNFRDMSMDKIEEFKRGFGKQGEKTLQNAMKGAVLDTLEKSKQSGNTDVISNLIGTQGKRAKLKAALGEKEYSKLISKLEIERKVQGGNQDFGINKLSAPSDLEQIGKKVVSGVQTAGDIITTTKGKIPVSVAQRASERVVKLFNKKSPQDRQKMVEILLDNKKGRDFLKKAIPEMEKRELDALSDAEFKRKLFKKLNPGITSGLIKLRELDKNKRRR